MKLTANFTHLKLMAKKMGADDITFTPKVKKSAEIELVEELESTKGLSINPENLDIKAGMLCYQGYQVVVFIPDHQYKGVEAVLQNFANGNKYHVAECSTIQSMKAKGQYETRYSASRNPDGIFQIFDQHQQANTPLLPCQNCLKHINYKGFRGMLSAEKRALVNHLKIDDLLSTYSTLFKEEPKRQRINLFGYSNNWQEITLEYRKSKNFTCECCGVNLTSEGALLHTHHINRNKQDNAPENLQALCIDCHRKQDNHDHLKITHAQMTRINELRREQGLLDDLEDWDKIFEYADEAVHGLLHHYKKNNSAKPEIGYEIANNRGAIVAELELAWPNLKKGIAIDEDNVQQSLAQGWQVISVDEAVIRINT